MGPEQNNLNNKPYKASNKIIYPDNPNYDDDRKERNKAFDIRPNAIYFCENEQDVLDAMQLAKKNKWDVRIRAGRHSYEAFSAADNALVIDVSHINTMELSSDRSTVTIGSGCQLYDVYEYLNKSQLTYSAGSGATVCAGGLIQGGGIGFVSRYFGLSSDNVLSLKIVTANGSILTADRDQNPDLYWACCGGGGGNFGVVTHFTMKTWPAIDVGVFKIDYPWSCLREMLKNWFLVQNKGSNKLMIFAHVTSSKTGKIQSFGQYYGSLDQMKKEISPLMDIKGAHITEMKEETFFQAVIEHSGSIKPHPIHPFIQERPFKARSFFIKKALDDNAIDVIEQLHSRADCPIDTVSIIDSWGGEIAALAPDYNAFVHRDALASMQNLVYWDNDKEKEANTKWSQDFADAFRSFTKGSYRNYPDLDLKDWQQEYYGKHYQRLVEIKQKYDPGNLFHFEQSIGK